MMTQGHKLNDVARTMTSVNYKSGRYFAITTFDFK